LLEVSNILNAVPVFSCELQALPYNNVLVSAVVLRIKHVSKVMSLNLSACIEPKTTESVTAP
jgi:hypothetical protein